MNSIKLEELVGGALQEKFSRSLENVVENLQNPNTPYKNKRNITIKLTFEQNEARDDVKVNIDVQEKLAPQTPLQTSFAVGRDLKDGNLYVEEYGKQIKGQMNLAQVYNQANTQEIDGKTVDTETGEIKEEPGKVVDLRKVKAL